MNKESVRRNIWLRWLRHMVLRLSAISCIDFGWRKGRKKQSQGRQMAPWNKHETETSKSLRITLFFLFRQWRITLFCDVMSDFVPLIMLLIQWNTFVFLPLYIFPASPCKSMIHCRALLVTSRLMKRKWLCTDFWESDSSHVFFSPLLAVGGLH